MKKVIYICDKCGKEIQNGETYKFTSETTSAEHSECFQLSGRLRNMDYCYKCFDKIINFMIQNVVEDCKSLKSEPDANDVKLLLKKGYSAAEIERELAIDHTTSSRLIDIARKELKQREKELTEKIIGGNCK